MKLYIVKIGGTPWKFTRNEIYEFFTRESADLYFKVRNSGGQTNFNMGAIQERWKE